MQITVTFYGGLKQRLGEREIELELPRTDATVEHALNRLVELYPQLDGRLERIAVAVGDSIVSISHPVEDGDDLALLPPVSGG